MANPIWGKLHDELFSITPLDGRYYAELKELAEYFSEYALIRERVFVEIEYLKFVSTRMGLKVNEKDLSKLGILKNNFSISDAKRIKAFEKKVEHDVKAVELYLTTRLTEFKELLPFIHFGLTSEDINNLAYGRLLKRFVSNVLTPIIKMLISQLTELAERYHDAAMLSRTHGQPASPTTFGKEVSVFAYRLTNKLMAIRDFKFVGKLNGAVGNYNALAVAIPDVDWLEESKAFVRSLGLEPVVVTTQILPHDHYSELLFHIQSANNIVNSLNRDLWMYYSYGYFKLESDKFEVDSSTMPHKVNPKELENSEGNLELANALLGMMSSRLQISRMQRDLSDSTIKRNYGAAFGFTILGYKRTMNGIKRLKVNKQRLIEDIRLHPEVFSEALQTIMRREGLPNAYFKVRSRIRGKALTLKDLFVIAEKIKLSKAGRNSLQNAIKTNYVGLASNITLATVNEIRQYLKLINHQ
jgi:adenylosuccinate lyase